MQGYSAFNPYQNPFTAGADPQGQDWLTRQKIQAAASVAPGSFIQNLPGIQPSGSPTVSGGPGERLGANDIHNMIAAIPDAAVASRPVGDVAKAQFSAANASPSNPMGSGKISDNYYNNEGTYYQDVPYDKSGSLINDPSQAMGFWAKYHGYNQAYANRLSSVFNITDLLRAMGINGTQLTGGNLLDWEGRLADRLSGRVASGGGGYNYLDAPSIVKNIFNTPRAGLGTGAGQLSTAINNPNLQPEDQIKNVAEFALGSLQGVLTNDQLNAYSQVLDQLATAFMQQYDTSVGTTDEMPTFLEFVRQYGGQYGGMF